MAVLDDTVNGNPAVRGRSQRWGERWRVSPLVAVLAAILLILILPPTLYLIATSFYTTRPDGAFDQLTLRYFSRRRSRQAPPARNPSRPTERV